MKHLEFFINELPRTPNSLNRKHWSSFKKESQKWHQYVFLNAFWDQEPLKRAKLTLTRISTREPDFDGLVGSFKYVIDGLVKANVLADDKYSVIGQSEYKWEKAKKRCDQGIRIKVEF